MSKKLIQVHDAFSVNDVIYEILMAHREERSAKVKVNSKDTHDEILK
jgi:hypothetical protein